MSPFAKGHKPAHLIGVSRKRKPAQIPVELVDKVHEAQGKILEQVKRKAASKIGIFERVYGGMAPLRQVIKAKCLECQDFTTESVRNCRVLTCPIWRVRPFQK